MKGLKEFLGFIAIVLAGIYMPWIGVGFIIAGIIIYGAIKDDKKPHMERVKVTSQIDRIKAVREATGCSLADAKAFIAAQEGK